MMDQTGLHRFLYDEANFGRSDLEPTSMAPLIYTDDLFFYYQWAERENVMWIATIGHGVLKLWRHNFARGKNFVAISLAKPRWVGEKAAAQVRKHCMRAV